MSKSRSKKTSDTLDDMILLGDVKGKDIFIIDDEINTGGTIVRAAKMLKMNGANKTYVSCTHPVFAGPAVERLKEAPIEEVVVLNTIPIPKEKQFKKLTVLSTAEVFGELIKIVNEGRPMGVFLDNL